MKIVTQTALLLELRRAPWVAWSGAMVVLLFGVVQVGAPFVEPSLHCDERECVLRLNVVDGPQKLPKRALTGAESEANAQRPMMARLILRVRDDRLPFDLRFEPRARVAADVERIERFVAGRDLSLHLGPEPRPQYALTMLAVFFLAAVLVAASGKYESFAFDAVQQEVRVRRGFHSRRVPLMDVRALRIEGAAEQVMSIELSNGERIELDRYVMADRPDKRELAEAIRGIIPQK